MPEQQSYAQGATCRDRSVDGADSEDAVDPTRDRGVPLAHVNVVLRDQRAVRAGRVAVVEVHVRVAVVVVVEVLEGARPHPGGGIPAPRLAEQKALAERVVCVQCERVLTRPEGAALDLGDDRRPAGHLGVTDDATHELGADDAEVT